MLGASALLAPCARHPRTRLAEQPLRVVAGGAGGLTDIRARWLADRLARGARSAGGGGEQYGAAGGNVGAAQVARSAPDGYTLLLIHQGTAAANPHLFGHTGYNPLTDFAPITRFGHGSLLLSVNPGGPPSRSAGELIALSKPSPAR